jgi:hypothetical protein
MHQFFSLVLTFLLATPALPADDVDRPVTATIETTLTTAPGQIRQFAFDGDANTFFASARSPRQSDHFTLVFDRPVTVKSISVTTGRPDGGDLLESGSLGVSTSARSFSQVARFRQGVARAQPGNQRIAAIRIRPANDPNHPLVIREITIQSEPNVATFRYPVEFVVNVDDAPEMKPWADNVARVCERAYPMINDELKSDGFTPARIVTMTLKKDYRGVAATSGDHIVGSVNYFKAHPDDVGAMVHETVHVVQRYRGKSPGWLVEGIADYIRFFKYEPGKLGRINPSRAKYNGSYRVSAAFLAYVKDKYDKDLVRKLNAALRESRYEDAMFKQWTGKTLQELDTEWRASLGR